MSPDAQSRQTILIVDDAPMNRALLADMLGADYNIVEAENGAEAIAAMQRLGTQISLVLLDIVMPEMDGFDVLATMNGRGWIADIPVIIISSEKKSAAIERAYLLGVTDFISRPFDTSIVRHRVNNTLMLYAKQKALADMVVDQIAERERSVGLMVSILSQIVEFRNGESGLHVLHVNTLTEMLLKELVRSGGCDLTPQQIKDITMASSLHDIGKISIPEEVLNKPGKLTDDEFTLMKQHSAIGAGMLQALPSFEDEALIKTAYEICRWHHERWDGGGYPDGLTGDDIPLSAQVVALADVYDALTSERVYKPAFPHEQAMQMILNGECGQFNPVLLECFERIADAVRHELQLDSLATHTTRETERVAQAAARISAAATDALAPSARTLDLLEHERAKFDFYAKMSHEVQFEVTVDPPIMLVSDWGARPLGLPELILDPLHDAALAQMFGEEALREMADSLRATTPDEPIVEYDLRATVDGAPRWFHLYARAMWAESAGAEPRFDGAIGKLIDVHESVMRLTELERRATHDSLTGLTTHDFARQLIGERMQGAPEGSFLLMVIDVDHFKDANDSHGHLHGDEVLKELAAALRAAVRDRDIVARVGGDEFLIFMTCEADPEPVVARVFRTVSERMAQAGITVSMGAMCVHGAQVPYENLFGAADALLYEMKRAGRDGYVLRQATAAELAQADEEALCH